MNDIDVNKLCDLSIEIGNLFKEIKNLFPDDNGNMLRHLAASSIHMALFMQDFYEIHRGEKVGTDDKAIKQFLDNCGCSSNE